MDSNEDEEMIKITYFTADWCKPCKVLKPIMAEVAKLGTVTVVVIDVDKEPGIAARYNVQGLPTLVFEDAKGIIARLTGNKFGANEIYNQIAVCYELQQ